MKTDRTPSCSEASGAALAVLLVSPGVELADWVCRTLDSDGGIVLRFEQVADAEAAVARVAEGTLDTVLLDLAVPGAGELLARLAATAPALPVIALTAKGDASPAPRTVPAGALECLAPSAADRRLLSYLLRYVGERKRGAEQLREQERLLGMMQEAQRAESLSVLAGGLAHDYNNLLMSIMGNVSLALNELRPDSPAQAYIKQIQVAAERAGELTSQMLIYAGKGTFETASLNLSRLVGEIPRLVDAAVSKRAAIEYHLAENLPCIAGDARQLRQAVLNLVSNASEAIGDRDGTITIATGLRSVEDTAVLDEPYLRNTLAIGDYVWLEVADTGSGMDAATKARIFDPFFTTKFTGRGLGLPGVLGIMRAHRGAIKVHSEPGRGTVVRLLFPVAAACKPVVDTTASDRERDWRGKGVILIVDDEELVRNVAKTVLQRKGFQVLTAADGREGVSIFREHAATIDLVLLDLTMPHMNGAEAFVEMRRIRPDARVILSSGYAEPEATRDFRDQGLAGFLPKPYMPSALIAKVRQVLER